MRLKALLPVAVAGLIGVMIVAVQGQAQSTEVANAKPVAVLVQKPQQLPVVLESSEQLRRGTIGVPAREVHVIVCGQAVEALAADHEHNALLNQTTQAGVRVVACGISLEKFDIPSDALNANVEIVANGLLEMVRLNDEGSTSLEL